MVAPTSNQQLNRVTLMRCLNVSEPQPIAPDLKPEIHIMSDLQEYSDMLLRMQQFTRNRSSAEPDQIWLLEHQPVFTLGANADIAHLVQHTDIPLVQSDRGGQITYHGPGQLICYLMLNLEKIGCSVHQFVNLIEAMLVALLASHEIEAHTLEHKRGVYVNNRKIASIGLRCKRKCSYHGFALNIDMDLKPFSLINPCGYVGLEMTDMNRESAVNISPTTVKQQLPQFIHQFLYPTKMETTS